MQYYTNTQGLDGFGAQYQRIILNYIYCKINNLQFVYNPFLKIEHNYNKDPLFIENIENLINLKKNITNNCQELNTQFINFGIVCKFFESNIDFYCQSEHMQFIKNCFWQNKERDYFKNGKINVAVHVRRPNPHDNRKQGSDTPDNYYLNIIRIIREKYKKIDLLFHIYSQGEDKNFEIFKAEDTILHLNEELPLTFISMVAADILVTSASSLSYAAALLSDGVIYYKRFWHNPRKDWFIFD